MLARSQQTVSYVPQLQAADIARNPGVVSMLVGLFGLYIVGFATSARNDLRKRRTRLQALWHTDKVQRLISRLVATELFVDQNIVYHYGEQSTALHGTLALQSHDVEQVQQAPPARAKAYSTPSRYRSSTDGSTSCLHILQAEARPQSIWQEWLTGLRINHRLLSLFVSDNLWFLSQRQKLTLVFCQVRRWMSLFAAYCMQLLRTHDVLL